MTPHLHSGSKKRKCVSSFCPAPVWSLYRLHYLLQHLDYAVPARTLFVEGLAFITIIPDVLCPKLLQLTVPAFTVSGSQTSWQTGVIQCHYTITCIQTLYVVGQCIFLSIVLELCMSTLKSISNQSHIPLICTHTSPIKLILTLKTQKAQAEYLAWFAVRKLVRDRSDLNLDP